jgi:molybdopterin synthase catalytic subunit
VARVLVQQHQFDLAREYVALASLNGVGGIGCFIGLVRGGDGLTAMTLEHYPAMTERALAAIAVEAQRRWALLGVTVAHRYGRLTPGEPIVLVLAAAAHRAAALDATRFLIDWLKTDAPFWKQEEFSDGTSRWVAAREADAAARAGWADD